MTEIKAPTGYNLNTTPITVEGLYQGQQAVTFNVDQIMTDTVITGNINIKKLAIPNYVDAETPIDGNLLGLKGAEFTLTLNSDPDNVNYHFVGTTDADGQLTFKDIPYGTYTLSETKTPEGYKTVNPIQNVVVQEQGKTYAYHLANYPMASEVRIKKLDAADGQTVALAGTTFKILDTKTNTFVSLPVGLLQKNEWITNASGSLMLDKALAAGEHALIEVKAPGGYHTYKGGKTYTVNGQTYNGVPFTVSETTSTIETSGDKSYFVTEVTLENEALKGRIQIEKTGEMLIGTKEETIQGEAVIRFVYEQQALEGVTFDIIAAEDIAGAPYVKPELYAEAIKNLPNPNNVNYREKLKEWQTNYLESRIICKAGTVVATITTDSEGKAMTDLLPMGKYKVVESSVPEGFVLDPTEHEVEIKDNGEIADMDNIATMGIANNRQQVCFTLNKLEETFKDYEQVGKEIHIITTHEKAQDITFGIYTAEAMTIGQSPSEPRVMDSEALSPAITTVPVDTLVDYIQVEDGVAKTTAELPPGKYYYKEIQTKDHLILDNTKYPIEWQYDSTQGSTIEIYANEGKDVINRMRPIPFELSKTDIATGEPVPGVKVRLYNEQQQVIYEGITDTEGKITLEALVPGNYYYQEYEAPAGYELEESLYPFEVKTTDATIKCQMTNKKITVPETGVTGGNFPLFVAVTAIGMGSIIAGAYVLRRKRMMK